MVTYVRFESILMSTQEMPDILTLKQACEVLNCHPNTLRKWADEGKLPVIRFGSRGDRRFKKGEILELVSYKAGE